MKRITISESSAEVESRLSRRDETRIRELVRYYRDAGFSDEVISSRYKSYMRRYLKSERYRNSEFACDGAVNYAAECLIMSEVFRRLAEERGMYI